MHVPIDFKELRGRAVSLRKVVLAPMEAFEGIAMGCLKPSWVDEIGAESMCGNFIQVPENQALACMAFN